MSQDRNDGVSAISGDNEMSEITSSSDDNEMSEITSSSDILETGALHSTFDSMVVNMDNNNTLITSQNVTDEHSNPEKVSTEKDPSIAGEFNELVLSASNTSFTDPPCSEDSQISTPPSSLKQMDALSVDEPKQDDVYKKEILLSPTKRRHISSKEEPECKKLNTSLGEDLASLASNYDEKLKETPFLQSAEEPFESVTEITPRSVEENPVLGDLEPSADFPGGSMVLNDGNKSPFKVPPLPTREMTQEEIAKESSMLFCLLDGVKQSREIYIDGFKGPAPISCSRAIPPAETSESEDTSMKSLQSGKDIGEKSQSEIASPDPVQKSQNSSDTSVTEQSDLIIKPATEFPVILPIEIQEVTSDNPIPELETPVD